MHRAVGRAQRRRDDRESHKKRKRLARPAAVVDKGREYARGSIMRRHVDEGDEDDEEAGQVEDEDEAF